MSYAINKWPTVGQIEKYKNNVFYSVKLKCLVKTVISKENSM